MFLELEDATNSQRRALLNLDLVFMIERGPAGEAIAVNLAGNRVTLPATYSLTRDAIEAITDEDEGEGGELDS